MGAAPITIVTGSRKGIGRHLAQHYAALGHSVIGCSRGPADWEAPGYTHHQVDITSEPDVKKWFAAIRKEHGTVQNLVNNAGIASMNHALLTPASAVDKVMRTNLLGSFLTSREAAKLMKREGYGRIVNFTTVAVPFSLEGEAAYVASKAAVEALTRVLARELGALRHHRERRGPGADQDRPHRGSAPREDRGARRAPADQAFRRARRRHERRRLLPASRERLRDGSVPLPRRRLMYIDFLRESFAKHAGEPALIWRDKPFGYDWLLAEVDRRKAELERERVPKGAVVSLEADFSPTSAALLLALIEHGAIVVPANELRRGEEARVPSRLPRSRPSLRSTMRTT